MQNKGKALLTISLVIGLFALATSIVQIASPLTQTSSRTVQNSGSVKGIGVGIYWDSACTNVTSSINWGLLDPGSNRVVTIYVRNQGNAVATLSKVVENWNPSTTSNYMTLNWDYAGQTLKVNQVLQLKLTLTVLSTISGVTAFSFDIKIVATG